MLGCVQAGSTAGGAGTAACVDGCLTSLGRELSQTWRRVQLKGALRGGCSAAEWSMCESMLYCRLPCGTCSAACRGAPARRALFGPVPPSRCAPSERVRGHCFHRVYTMAKVRHSKTCLDRLTSPQHHSIRPQLLRRPSLKETPQVLAHSSRINGDDDWQADRLALGQMVVEYMSCSIF